MSFIVIVIIENLRVSCYNGINDRAACALFVKYPRVQGEWPCQNWLHHSPCSLGCLTNNARAVPVIIPCVITSFVII